MGRSGGFWRGVLFVFLASAPAWGGNFSTFLISATFSEIKEQFGISPSAVGLIIALQAVGAIIATLTSAAFINKCGRNIMLGGYSTAFFVGIILSSVVVQWKLHFGFLAAAVILIGAAGTAMAGLSNGYILAAFGDSVYIAKIFMCKTLIDRSGYAIAFQLLPWSSDTFGLEFTYWMVSCVTGVVAFACWVLIFLTLKRRKKTPSLLRSKTQEEIFVMSSASQSLLIMKKNRSSFLSMLRGLTLPFSLVTIAYFFNQMTMFGFLGSSNDIFADELGLSNSLAGTASAFCFYVVMIATIPTGFFFDHFGLRTHSFLLMGLLITLSPFILLLFALIQPKDLVSFLGAAFSTSLCGISNALVVNVAYTSPVFLLKDLATKSSAPFLLYSVQGLARVIGNVATTSLRDLSGSYQLSLITLTLIGSLSILISFALAFVDRKRGSPYNRRKCFIVMLLESQIFPPVAPRYHCKREQLELHSGSVRLDLGLYSHQCTSDPNCNHQLDLQQLKEVCGETWNTRKLQKLSSHFNSLTGGSLTLNKESFCQEFFPLPKYNLAREYFWNLLNPNPNGGICFTEFALFSSIFSTDHLLPKLGYCFAKIAPSHETMSFSELTTLFHKLCQSESKRFLDTFTETQNLEESVDEIDFSSYVDVWRKLQAWDRFNTIFAGILGLQQNSVTGDWQTVNEEKLDRADSEVTLQDLEKAVPNRLIRSISAIFKKFARKEKTADPVITEEDFFRLFHSLYLPTPTFGRSLYCAFKSAYSRSHPCEGGEGHLVIDAGITYPQFLFALTVLNQGSPQLRGELFFDTFDTDHNGELERGEFIEAMESFVSWGKHPPPFEREMLSEWSSFLYYVYTCKCSETLSRKHWMQMINEFPDFASVFSTLLVGFERRNK